MANKIVGLDLGTHSVKVTELVSSFRKFDLVGFDLERVDNAADGERDFSMLAAAARRLLERRGLLHETIICALPSDLVSTLTFSFPFSAPKKIEAVISFQLDEAIPIDVDEVIYDYQVIERGESGGVTVLVAYVRATVFEEFIEAMQAAGVDPKVVGIGALSYLNLYDAFARESGDAPVAVVDVGHDHTELVIFDRGTPRLVRNISSGGREVTRELSETFGVDADQAERGKHSEGALAPVSVDTQVDTQVTHRVDGEASRAETIDRACRRALQPMLREVRRSLASHESTSDRPVTRIYVTGGTTQLRGFLPWLQARLELPVTPLDPLGQAYNRLPEDGGGRRPFIAKSLALGLPLFQRSRKSVINFRKGDFAYTGELGFLRGRIISLAVAAVMMIVLGSMVAVSRKRVLEAEYQALANQVASLSQQILGVESTDVDALFNAVVAGKQNQAAELIPDVSAFEMLAQISGAIDHDLKVDLDRVEIDLERKKLELHGKTGSGGDVERIVDAVRQTRCYRSRVSKERVEKSVDDRTMFRISGTSNCG